MENEIQRATTQGIKKQFSNFGDWVPPPGSNGVEVPGGAEPKTPGELSAGFSFVNDLRNMADMARAVGNAADEAKYTAAFNKWKAEWHTAWYDTEAGNYDSGHQTAHVLALQIDAPPADLKPKVLETLVQNILAHDNHTTCGIIGWRFELDVLSANGYGDLAYALITQQTYPSLGFEILDADEPATTIWELWDSPYEGPGMDSRNRKSARPGIRAHASLANEACLARHHVRCDGGVGVPVRGGLDAGAGLGRLRARVVRAAAQAAGAGGARRDFPELLDHLAAAQVGLRLQDHHAGHLQR